MEINFNTIIFKSNPNQFNAEESGAKSNTWRQFTTSEELAKAEKFYDEWKAGLPKYVRIVKSTSPSIGNNALEAFSRQISHIEPNFNGWWGYSWRN